MMLCNDGVLAFARFPKPVEVAEHSGEMRQRLGLADLADIVPRFLAVYEYVFPTASWRPKSKRHTTYV